MKINYSQFINVSAMPQDAVWAFRGGDDVKLILVLVAASSAAAPSMAAVSFGGTILHQMFDRDPVTGVVTRLSDPLVTNFSVGAGISEFTTDASSAGFTPEFAGSSVNTRTNLGVGFLKAKSFVTADAARDGGQSVGNISFTDTLTFSNTGLANIMASMDGFREAVNTVTRSTANNGQFINSRFRLFSADVSQSACRSTPIIGFVPGDGPAGQVPFYFGCEAVVNVNPDLAAAQTYDNFLNFSFDAEAGESYTYSLSLGWRNRIDVLLDQDGLPNPDRLPASSLIDFYNTAKVTSLSVSDGTITSEAGPLSFQRGNLTYSAVHALTVPEPASWAMLIAGFGLTGATMRRRRAACAG